MGRTGGSLRFHTKSEYTKLNKDQRAELYQFIDLSSGTKYGDDNTANESGTKRFTRSGRFSKRVKSMFSEVLASEQREEPAVDDALKKCICSIVESKVKNTAISVSSTSATAPTITGTLRSNLAKK